MWHINTDIGIRPFNMRDTLSVKALSSSLKIILAKTIVYHSKRNEKIAMV